MARSQDLSCSVLTSFASGKEEAYVVVGKKMVWAEEAVHCAYAVDSRNVHATRWRHTVMDSRRRRVSAAATYRMVRRMVEA